MSMVGVLRRWVLVGVFTVVPFDSLLPGAMGQAGSFRPVESPSVVGVNPLAPVPPGDGDINAPGPAPAPPAPAGFSIDRSATDVILESLFSDIYSPEARARWTPLPLGTFFTEGWDQPFVLPPSGSGGAPRQGWVNGFGGTLFRAWFFAFAYANDLGHNGNQYLGQYTIFVPFNRRFELQVDYDFIVANKGGSNNSYHGNTGDTSLYGRFQLSESKDFGQLFQLGVRTPTGARDNGSGVASLAPQYQFWYNLYGNWALRGVTGVTVPTNHAGTRTQSNNVLALGRYFKGSDDGWIRQLWIYLVATENSTIAGSARRESYFSLLPGFRTQITGLWFFFASVEVPMVGPQAFSYQPIIAILKDY
jgi:hypothetical protein